MAGDSPATTNPGRGAEFMQNTKQRLWRTLNYSQPVGRWLLGIPLELHWTVLLLPVLTWSLLAQIDDLPFWKQALGACLLPTMVLGFVYLHECGHAFADRLYGLPVQRIVLTMLGGICWAGWPRSNREELVVTLCGPLVNVAFTVVSLGALLGWQGVLGQPFGLVWFTCEFSSWTATGMELLTLTLVVNLVQAGFNLLVPMFPMDSGRILRATLAGWCSPAKATVIVVRLGQVLGAAVIGLGLVLEFSEFHGDGLQLVAIATMMMFFGHRELMRIRVQPVYNTPAGAGVGSGQAWVIAAAGSYPASAVEPATLSSADPHGPVDGQP